MNESLSYFLLGARRGNTKFDVIEFLDIFFKYLKMSLDITDWKKVFIERRWNYGR